MKYKASNQNIDTLTPSDTPAVAYAMTTYPNDKNAKPNACLAKLDGSLP